MFVDGGLGRVGNYSNQLYVSLRPFSLSSSSFTMASYHAAPSTDVDLDNSRGASYNEKPARRGVSPWLKFGVPVALLVIIGAVLGGVLGTQLHKSSKHNSSSGGGGGGSTTSSKLSPSQSSSLASAMSTAKVDIGRFPASTDTYGLPVYPSTTNTAIYGDPTFVTSSAAWPTDTFKPSNPSATTVRPDRPRLIAPAYKWEACTFPCPFPVC